MKIKAVCEITGLSDRTVRYYVEEGLITPSYTENYLGRKTFDFSEIDIKELSDIAVLRKFDFTIEEIRAIRNDIVTSRAILFDVKSRTKETLLNCQEKLAALSQINTLRLYTVAQLAEALSKPVLALPAQNEEISFSIVKKLIATVKKVLIFSIVWLPVILSILVVISSIRNYHYPVFNPVMSVATASTFIPSFAVLIVSKTQFSFRKRIQRILLFLCFLCIPVSFILSFGIISKSETTDFKNYCNLDATCFANRDLVFQELFPYSPHYFENVKQDDGNYKTVYLDAKYYYHYRQGFDCYDIYAEWPLEEANYDKEIQRVNELFKDALSNINHDYQFTKIKKGGYHCLILYYGNEPFTPTTDAYDYIIFAYNENLKAVRYICCGGMKNYGAYQPYYLSLDW
ncbi:MAG: MerR family transcriptional regulator [Clostridia bacterium]|nr:MerR family transcriptional regulator [Clostridia bacterium]